MLYRKIVDFSKYVVYGTTVYEYRSDYLDNYPGMLAFDALSCLSLGKEFVIRGRAKAKLWKGEMGWFTSKVVKVHSTYNYLADFQNKYGSKIYIRSNLEEPPKPTDFKSVRDDCYQMDSYEIVVPATYSSRVYNEIYEKVSNNGYLICDALFKNLDNTTANFILTDGIYIHCSSHDVDWCIYHDKNLGNPIKNRINFHDLGIKPLPNNEGPVRKYLITLGSFIVNYLKQKYSCLTDFDYYFNEDYNTAELVMKSSVIIFPVKSQPVLRDW